MTSRILYKSSVRHDLKKISQNDRERILRRIRLVLGSNPRNGEALHGEFEGLLKLRVGDYRIIFALVGQDILVLRTRHRGKAYGRALGQFGSVSGKVFPLGPFRL